MIIFFDIVKPCFWNQFTGWAYRNLSTWSILPTGASDNCNHNGGSYASVPSSILQTAVVEYLRVFGATIFSKNKDCGSFFVRAIVADVHSFSRLRTCFGFFSSYRI